ncbi:MAG TPA: PIG-L family deacetylase [Terriglobia bacterium]|nr:PIG-L family deacetylase [Terriglobia bacterium]
MIKVTRFRSIGCSTLGALIFLAVSTLGTAATPAHPQPPGAGSPWTADPAQIAEAPPSPGPDDRYKADILVIVAHPDDETMVTAYLAKVIFDEHKRVAVIYGTRGDGGGNAMGYEQAAALGAEREIEARRACAYLAIMNVWFLDGPDTPGQNVLRSLETWNHGAALGKAVRLVRLTRPEVILTWLPDYVAGENHDDHQAAGVIATEAFDLAGDPTKFPEQVAFPRDRLTISNLTEGLRPWQPKKIYYFSDASHTEFLEGQGPEFATAGVSPSRHLPYYRLAAEEMAFHLTQGDTGQEAKKALAAGQFQYFEQPVRLVFGKSLVGGSKTGDIFEGVTSEAIPFSPVRGYQPEAREGLSFELGGPWAFYREFWKAHNVEHLAQLLPTSEVELPAGATLHVPLLIHNDSLEPAEVTVSATLPQGWTERTGPARYPVAAHDVYPVETAVVVTAAKGQEWQTVTWKADANGRAINPITLRVKVTNGGGLPQ